MFRAFLPTAPARLVALAVAAAALAGCRHDGIRYVDLTHPPDVRQRHPILVGPQGAYVAHPCGQWPHDLGPAEPRLEALNRPHWNHGCATQHNLATIVANPNDLITPRAEGPIDANRRSTAIGRYRRNEQPQTVHSPIEPLTTIKGAVSGGG